MWYIFPTRTCLMIRPNNPREVSTPAMLAALKNLFHRQPTYSHLRGDDDDDSLDHKTLLPNPSSPQLLQSPLTNHTPRSQWRCSPASSTAFYTPAPASGSCTVPSKPKPSPTQMSGACTLSHHTVSYTLQSRRLCCHLTICSPGDERGTARLAYATVQRIHSPRERLPTRCGG